MKLVNKLLVVVSLLLFSMIKSQKCPEVFAGAFNNNKKAIKDVDALYPGDLATNSAYANAKANALKQTKAARNLFYKPNDKVVALLKALAKNVDALLKKNQFTSFNFIDFVNSGEQRQTADTGTAQETYLLYKGKKTANDDIKPLVADVKLTTIQALLTAVQGTPKPSEIVGFLGFLGDVGACVQDVFGRKKPNNDKQQIADIIVSYVNNLKDVFAEYYNKYSPDKYYNIDGKQSKPGERMSCFDATYDRSTKAEPRSGVMDAGADADTALSPANTIPKVGWPFQTIPKKLTEFCIDEPWAGHFSGSFYELVMMCQIFAFDPANDKWDAKHAIENEKKEICTSLGAGFLIGLGMHSAIEVAVPMKNYLGGSIANIDLGDATNKSALKGAVCGSGDNSATEYVSKMLIKYTKTSKKRKLK